MRRLNFDGLDFLGVGRSAALCTLLMGPAPALAEPTLSLLHSFKGGPSDAAGPRGPLLLDSDDNLYGTTFSGGAHGHGIVFKLAPDGVFRVLHSFCGRPDCVDGANPNGGLIADEKGNLYGTTQNGGWPGCPPNRHTLYRCGTVFKLAPDGAYTVLSYSVVLPLAGLLADRNGNLYGTNYGFQVSGGTVFKLAPDGTGTTLYRFTGQDGFFPLGRLIADRAGNLYGTTSFGGPPSGEGGTVFKLAPDGSEYKVLHSFTEEPGAGGEPNGSLAIDREGNLYGAAVETGAGCRGRACPAVFKLASDGTKYTVLHYFPDRLIGEVSSLTVDSAGNLYGSTARGGAYNRGTVFKLSPDGTLTELHSFISSEGSNPRGGLVADKLGNLYGVTDSTIFKLSGTGFVTEVPFAALQANLRIIFGTAPTDSGYLRSSFTLGINTNGIDPRTEPVTLGVGSITAAIPPGSFRGGDSGPWTFDGLVGGVRVSATIRRIDASRYSLDATVTGANLRGTLNPVPVALTIGNDRGSTSVDAEFGSPWRRIARSR